MFIDWKLSRNEKVCVGEYALKKKESYWLTQPIIAHGSGSADCWKTGEQEENSRPRSRSTVFTLADNRAIQQTRQRIAQCKLSITLLASELSEGLVVVEELPTLAINRNISLVTSLSF